MAKKSVIVRGKKREELVKKYAAKRAALQSAIKKADSLEESLIQQEKQRQLPRDSSSTRVTRRCGQCGRPRGVYRKFGLCRICLRNALMQGNVPGGRKASW